MLPGKNSFQLMQDEQEICEKEEVLGKRVVDTVADAVAISGNTPGCTRKLRIFLRGVSAGWIAGATSEAFSLMMPYVDGLSSRINGCAVRCFGPNKVSVPCNCSCWKANKLDR